MSGREGGKKKPLKAPKKQGGDLDDDDKVRMKNTSCVEQYLWISSTGIPSQAERRAEEAEGDASEGCRQGAPGGRWDQEVWKEIEECVTKPSCFNIALTDCSPCLEQFTLIVLNNL